MIEKKVGIRCFFFICETFPNETNSRLFSLPGNNFICKSIDKRKGGGVAIYLQDHISYTLRNDLSIFVEGEFESVS